MTTRLWVLIQQWLDAQLVRVSQAALADAVGVTRSAISQWKSGQAKPTPENLRQLSRVTRIPYDRLLDAVVHDMGYLGGEDGGEHDDGSAPMNQAGESPATVRRLKPKAASADDVDLSRWAARHGVPGALPDTTTGEESQDSGSDEPA